MSLRLNFNEGELTDSKMAKAAFRKECGLHWVQGLDSNQGPSGYEPDELPGCSTLQ
tara:strand:- start:51636 stop:51803 length:168 start_codon:yes stop_codon:yes gene_type:complete